MKFHRYAILHLNDLIVEHLAVGQMQSAHCNSSGGHGEGGNFFNKTDVQNLRIT